MKRFELDELERATNNFSEHWLLGSGAFGNVYRGTFDKEGALAIKRAHAASYQSAEEFRNGKLQLKPSQIMILFCTTIKKIRLVDLFFFSKLS